MPDRGELVWVELDPRKGHEQDKRRPALVLSPKAYNGKAGLTVVVPITSQVKGYPFEVACTGKHVRGVVLADQVRCVDWRARNVALIERAPVAVLRTVQGMVRALIFE